MQNITKIILAILFFICLADLPYGYYQFVRFVALLGFGALAYWAAKDKNQTQTIIYIALAILFQPLFKIALGKDLWNIIDVIAGACLLASVWINPSLKK